MSQINFFISEYYDEFYMLNDYPVEGLMREMTTDVNELINYVLAHVMPSAPSIDGSDAKDAAYHIPNFLSNTMQYIVAVRAENGGVFDVQTMLAVKEQVNRLVIEYVRALSENPHWFNHHLKFITSAIGGIRVVSPSLAVCVEYGQAKMTEQHDLAMSRSLGPQILSAIQMSVMRL